MRGLKISEILLRIFLVFAGLAAALLVSETILRFTHFQTFILHEATPAGYFSEDTNLGRDITPNIPPTLSPFYDHPYMVWSNELGCFDRPYLGETPYIYLTGDSQTWGYAPYEYKWGTKLEGLLHTRIVKCGVPGYGTMQEFLKTSRDMERLAAPELIIVGYFDNDILDDERQYPRTERKVGTGRHWDGAQSWLNDH